MAEAEVAEVAEEAEGWRRRRRRRRRRGWRRRRRRRRWRRRRWWRRRIEVHPPDRVPVAGAVPHVPVGPGRDPERVVARGRPLRTDVAVDIDLADVERVVLGEPERVSGRSRGDAGDPPVAGNRVLRDRPGRRDLADVPAGKLREPEVAVRADLDVPGQRLLGRYRVTRSGRTGSPDRAGRCCPRSPR